MGKIDEEWLITWLAKRGDITCDDIVNAKKHDSEVVVQLLHYVLQWPPSMRMNQYSKSKVVAERVFHQRADEVGKRLEKFRARGFKNGAVEWKGKCYEFVWSDDGTEATVKQVRHWNGEVADVPAHVMITRLHTLQCNWSDFSACVARSPVPPLKLCDLFKAKKNGPWSFPAPLKAKEFEKVCERVDAEAQEQKRKMQMTTATSVNETAGKLAEMTQEKKAASLQKARKRAQETVAESKKKRVIALG